MTKTVNTRSLLCDMMMLWTKKHGHEPNLIFWPLTALNALADDGTGFTNWIDTLEAGDVFEAMGCTCIVTTEDKFSFAYRKKPFSTKSAVSADEGSRAAVNALVAAVEKSSGSKVVHILFPLRLIRSLSRRSEWPELENKTPIVLGNAYQVSEGRTLSVYDGKDVVCVVEYRSKHAI